MWHIKNAVVFYYEAKIIIEMREKLLTRGGVYILRDLNRPKSDHRLFFFRICASMDKLLSFQEKNITNFFSIVQGSAREKKQTIMKLL